LVYHSLERRKPIEDRRQEPGSRRGEAGFETYDEKTDGITRWNIDHTDILEVLRGQIHEKRLISWSKAFRIGVRKVIKGVGYWSRSREYEALRDLYQFITKQRITLLGNPTMREAKGIGGNGPSFGLCHLLNKGFPAGKGTSRNDEYHNVETSGEVFGVRLSLPR
jgi:hypothetical protein